MLVGEEQRRSVTSIAMKPRTRCLFSKDVVDTFEIVDRERSAITGVNRPHDHPQALVAGIPEKRAQCILVVAKVSHWAPEKAVVAESRPSETCTNRVVTDGVGDHDTYLIRRIPHATRHRSGECVLS